MRGDRPRQGHGLTGAGVFTPHARGSTLRTLADYQEALVYPACAGIDPQSPPPHGGLRSLPRMRGDRPYLFHVLTS